MQPGQQPPARNTRLSLVARNALKPLLGDDNAAEVEKQVEAGKLSPRRPGRPGAQGPGLRQGGRLAHLRHRQPAGSRPGLPRTATATTPRSRRRRRPRNSSASSASTFEVDLPADAPLPELRDRLARHVLMTDLVAGLGDSRAPVAGLGQGRHVARRQGRLRGRGPHLAAAAGRAGQLRRRRPQGRAGVLARPARLRPATTRTGVETFLCRGAGPAAARRGVAAGDGRRRDLLDLALSRLSRFWAEVDPDVQARWALVASAAEVLLEADRVAKALKKAPTTVPALVEAYAEGDEPVVPARHAPPAHGEPLVQLRVRAAATTSRAWRSSSIKAEQRYTEVGSELAKHFVTQLRQGQAPDQGPAAAGAGLRDAGQAPPRRGQGRLRLGRCPAVRDGP